jgi:hypothetical protein
MALLWTINLDPIYVDEAISIFNAWSPVLKNQGPASGALGRSVMGGCILEWRCRNDQTYILWYISH